MKKKLTLISVILLILLAFTACNNDNDPAQVYLDFLQFDAKAPSSDIIIESALENGKAVDITKTNVEAYIDTAMLYDYIASQVYGYSTYDYDFAITDASGSIMVAISADQETDPKVFTYTYEINDVVVDYTLTARNSEKQQHSISLSLNTVVVIDDSNPLSREITTTTSYTLNGKNMGELETRYDEATDTYLSAVYNGTDVLRLSYMN